MYKRISLATALFLSLLVACKKDKAGEEPDNKEAKINTVEMTHSRSTTVYGSDIIFKVKFDGIGTGNKAVDEYGILFKAWVENQPDKIPVSGTGSIILFQNTPVAGSVIQKEVTLTFQQFNDANYRAFARLKDGTYIYGEVLYFLSV